MSFQIFCDNCGEAVKLANSGAPWPAGWEAVPLSGRDGPVKHHCHECVAAVDDAKRRAREAVTQAEREALEMRRQQPKTGTGS